MGITEVTIFLVSNRKNKHRIEFLRIVAAENEATPAVMWVETASDQQFESHHVEHSAFASNDEWLLLHGGCLSFGNTRVTLAAHKGFHIPTNRWIDFASESAQFHRSPQRSWHSMHLIREGEDSVLYLHGGKNAKGATCDDLFRFHLRYRKWESMSHLTGGCCSPVMFGHKMVSIGTELVVIGSSDGTRKRTRECVEVSALMSVFSLHLGSPQLQWLQREISGSPRSRQDFEIATCDERILLVGGVFRGVWCDDAWMFNTKTNVWQQLAHSVPTVLRSRRFHFVPLFRGTWLMVSACGCCKISLANGKLNADSHVGFRELHGAPTFLIGSVSAAPPRHSRQIAVRLAEDFGVNSDELEFKMIPALWNGSGDCNSCSFSLAALTDQGRIFSLEMRLPSI